MAMDSNLSRLLVAAALALPVAFGLFLVMHLLIDRDWNPEEKETRKIADIHMPDREIETNLREQKPDKVDDPEEPPPDLETPDLDMDMDMDIVNIAPNAKVNISLNSSGMSTGDGEYLPIVKVAPIYPRRAQTRGIEGYCIIEYIVTRTGSIRDPQVFDCMPSGVFERASMKASLKFKYKPRIVDGEPIEVAGVQNKFTYELED